MQPINTLTSHRRPAAAAQHRHRPDHPQAVPQAHRAHRLRRLPLLRLALQLRHPDHVEPQPRLRPQQARVQGLRDPHRRKELRLRQLARARCLGHQPVRLPRRHRAQLRRHLLLQRRQERHHPRRAHRSRSRNPHPAHHRKPEAPHHHQPRSPDRHRRRRLQRALRHRPLPQILPAERPRRHRPHPAPRKRSQQLRIQTRPRILVRTQSQ